jgi:hypothetical protein
MLHIIMSVNRFVKYRFVTVPFYNIPFCNMYRFLTMYQFVTLPFCNAAPFCNVSLCNIVGERKGCVTYRFVIIYQDHDYSNIIT